MSIFSGILKVIGGIAAVAAGVALEVLNAGFTPLSVELITAGAGLTISGIGSLVAGNEPVKGLSTTTRNSVGAWEACYGEVRTGGTCVYINTWGNNNQMLDMVMVLAAHPCQSINEILFDKQRIQIDTTAIPTSAKAGYSIATPVAGSGTSFTPVQQTVNLSTITRSAEGVVTVVLPQDIPYLTAGDQVTVKNVTGDLTFNGIFQVSQIISRVPSGSTFILTFTYLNGGGAVSESSGQVATRWADYGRNVYVEYLTGAQTLGETFIGMTAGTPWQGTGKLVTPASPLNAGGTAAPNQWTNYCSLLGKTAVFIRLQFTQATFPNGIPQISFQLSGNNNVYDPRTSTYGYSTNSALCIADFLANTTWGFKAAYGTDIPATPLIDAANVCDQSVTLAIGGTEPRYTCNGKFSLGAKRGEVLENLLTSCAGRLTYSGGEYVINPAQWITPISTPVDLLANSAGNPTWKPTVSIRDLYNGVKGTYISPNNLWESTDFPPYAQDPDHGYSSDLNLAADDGDRRWKDIQLPFTISYATAQRLAKIELLRMRHWGTGTFICNMSAYDYTPMDIIQADHSYFGFSNKVLEVVATRLDPQKAPEGEGFALAVQLDVKETDSSIYAWSTSEELTPQGYVQSNWPQNQVVEAVCYPWSPGYVSPQSGDAYEGTQATFGVQPVYGVDASGNGTINLNIKGTAPVNNLDTDIESPLINVSVVGSGGTLAIGEYIVALSSRDAGSPPYQSTDYQSFGVCIVTAANSSIVVNITWGSGDDGGDLYIAEYGSSTATQDTFVFHHNQTVSPGASSATITAFDQTTAGGIDPIFDHFGVIWQPAVHTGPFAQVISAVTSTTITIPGPTTSSMTTNQWAGYSCSILAKADLTIEIPLLNIPIASSTASAMDGTFTLTVGPNALSNTLPDLTTLLAVGDLLSMDFNAAFTATSMTDNGIANAFYPTGATGVEAGHLAVVLTGADAGDVVTISSVSGTNDTTFNLATPWAITPATGDLVIICQPANAPEQDTQPMVTSMPLTGTVANVNVLNLQNSTWLFRVRTEDVNGNYGPDAATPYRVVFIFGSPGNTQGVLDWQSALNALPSGGGQVNLA